MIDDPQSELVLPIIALAEAVYIVDKGRTAIPTVQDLLNEVYGESASRDFSAHNGSTPHRRALERWIENLGGKEENTVVGLDGLLGWNYADTGIGRDSEFCG